MIISFFYTRERIWLLLIRIEYFLGGERMGNYVDVYTVENYSERVDELKRDFSSINDPAIQQNRGQLKNQIDILKAKEKQLLHKLNVNSIEKLNQRLEKYKSQMLNLSGPALYKEFLQIIDDRKDPNAMKKFRHLFYLTVREIINENSHRLPEYGNFSEAVQGLFLEALNSNKSGKGGARYRNTQAIRISNSKKLTDIINPFLLPPNQKKRILEIMEERHFIQANLNNITPDIQIIQGEEPQVVCWFDLTEQKTGAEVTTKEKVKASQILKNLILEKCPNADQHLLQLVIDHVLKRTDYSAFFVGKNDKQIIGILGEIQALYYICYLANTTPGEGVQWVGGLSKGGKMPHQDIVFDKLGIQVKNTTKDLQNNIDFNVNFWNLKLDSFLSRLGLDPSTIELFKNYYATYLFNVPYIKDGEVYYQSNKSQNKDFNSDRNDLASIRSQIDILLSVFASSLMYMDISQGISTVDANVLYILGGTAAITASKILEKVYNDLNNNTTPIRINASLNQEGINIVAALNEKKVRGKEIQTKFGSSNLVSNLKLQATYKFNLSHYF